MGADSAIGERLEWWGKINRTINRANLRGVGGGGEEKPEWRLLRREWEKRTLGRQE